MSVQYSYCINQSLILDKSYPDDFGCCTVVSFALVLVLGPKIMLLSVSLKALDSLDRLVATALMFSAA